MSQEAINDESDNVENQNESEPQIDDVIKNLKSEFSRKNENISSSLQALNEQVQALLAQQMQGGQKGEEAESELEDLIYSDPKKYAEIVTKRAVSEAERVVDRKVSSNQAMQAAVNQIASEYNEFAQMNSEAYKRAVEKFEKLPVSLKGTPEGVRMAMFETVAELGLVKSSQKRNAQNDDFSLSGKGGNMNRKPSRKDDSEIDPRTQAFAELLNQHTGRSKKEIAEGLKKTAKRTNWNKYKGVKDYE